MNPDKELAGRHHYHNNSVRDANNRTGDVNDPVGFPGHPMTPAERRVAGDTATVDKNSRKLCWNYNSHTG